MNESGRESTRPQNKNRLYHNEGNGAFSRVTSGSLVNDGGQSQACTWGDYDNDAFLDLFVANQSNEPNFLYRNNGNSNAWIKVRCVGTVSNRSAIGAKVRLKAIIRGKRVEQLREMTGGDGRSGQTLIAHFGLGDATNIDTLRIKWPSGIVQELHDVAPKQFLTVTESARLQAFRPGGFRVQSWKGMAFEVQASTDLKQWSPVTTVTNLTGTLEFTEPGAAQELRRFYRTVPR
jgi:ASPIC and UnbV/FG-GAP-like repeat